MTTPRLRSLAAPTVALAWLLAGCVNLTPPWEKATATGGTGGLRATGGAGGLAPDGGATEDGIGGAINPSSGGAGDAFGGSGGAIDARSMGTGREIDAGLGGGGGLDSAGSVIDGSTVRTDGAAGSIDGGVDVPLGGAGGRSGTGGTIGSGGIAQTGGATATGGATSTGGTTVRGGTTATGGATGGTTVRGGTTATGGATGGTTVRGGTTATGGATGTGGTAGRGGSTATGGMSGTGGATTADAGPDVQPDANPLANGLLAYYRCESATGSTLPDDSGHGNDATLSASGSYSFSAGKAGSALTLIRGNSGHVSMPPAMFRGLTQITIATWVKVVTAVDWQRLFDIGVNANLSLNPVSGSNTIAYMNFVPQGFQGAQAVFGITNTGYANEQRLGWSSALPTEWRHVAIVLSGSTGTLYVNGGGSPTVNTSMSLVPADLGNIDYAFIGRSPFSVDPYFDGAIDEFRVYNRALSSTEIQALYELTAP